MEEGHIVLDLMFGKTRVMICDDYCVHEQQQIDNILRSVAETVVKHLSAAATEKAVNETKESERKNDSSRDHRDGIQVQPRLQTSL